MSEKDLYSCDVDFADDFADLDPLVIPLVKFLGLRNCLWDLQKMTAIENGTENCGIRRDNHKRIGCV